MIILCGYMKNEKKGSGSIANNTMLALHIIALIELPIALIVTIPCHLILTKILDKK